MDAICFPRHFAGDYVRAQPGRTYSPMSLQAYTMKKRHGCCLEKRAEHITKLEKKSANETGMLAVHAEESIINATLAQWPSLALANRNTKQQFILGGPKPDLMAARKSLRRQRIRP